jgi:subtilase family serine protease
MINFSVPAHLRSWAVFCALAACGLAAGAMTGGGTARSASHEVGSSAVATFGDSPAITRESPSATSLFTQATVGQSCFQYPPSCYAPRLFLTAYGIQPLLDRGIDGRGETVVVPEVASQPPTAPPDVTDIRQDLARFDSLYDIPAARLQVVTTLAGKAAPYLAGFEEVEDVEIIHAVAPEATIDVIMVPPSDLNSSAGFVQAVLDFLRLAVPRGTVISISGSIGEHFITPAEATQLNVALQSAENHHVTVVASTGDTGAASDPVLDSPPVKEVSMPASDPLVLAAGGTSLALDPTTGAYSGEIAWNSSAGGFSHLFARPSYQDGLAGMTATRGVPDVAADADGNTGMAVAIASSASDYDLFPTSGTSAAAPLWAGVVALADQYAGRSLGLVNPAIYRIGRSPEGHTAFHDIAVGDNSVVVVPRLINGYQASRGWDPVTGWGSPNAQVLVPLLARDVP